MINDSNGTISTSTINQRKSGQNIDGGGGGGGGGLMFILSGNGVDYEHPEKSKFAINTFTGELFLISPLNRDPPDGREQYRLQIQAEDEHSEKINGSVTILIRVRDINDNQPYFEQNEYRAQVKENLAAGIDIIRLTAIDLDPDSILRYSIEVNRVNSDGDLIFDIDELSGLISTAVCCLDRESIAQYTIKICATDRSINGGDHHQQQQPPSIQSIVQQQQSMINQSSCTNVKINITDDNDEPPQFLRNHFYLSFMGEDNDDDDQKIDGNIDDHNHHHHHHHHHHYHQNQQKHLNGINQLYAQRILLNTTIIDRDLPETNRFVCRLDLNFLKFSIQVPLSSSSSSLSLSAITKQQQNNSSNQTTLTNIETLFWMFIKNETDNNNNIDSIDKLSSNRSSNHNNNYHHYNHHHHYTNMNKYFQCFISRLGSMRIQLSETFSPKYFRQTIQQEFDYYRQSLWNRFYQQYGGNGGFSSKNLLHLKDLIGFPDYVDLLLKISVSDLGYFEIPLTSSSSSSIQSIPSSSSSLQQRQQQLHFNDITGLLDTHVIHAELLIKLSLKTSNDSDDNNDNGNIDDNIDNNGNNDGDNQIINKQRISPYNDNDDDDSILKHRSTTTTNNNNNNNDRIIDSIDSNIDNSNKNDGRMNKFFQTFYYSIRFGERQNWLKTLSLLFGLILLIITILFLISKPKSVIRLINRRRTRRRRSKRHKFLNNHHQDDNGNNVNLGNDSMMPILLTTSTTKLRTIMDNNDNQINNDDDDNHTPSPLIKSPIDCQSIYDYHHHYNNQQHDHLQQQQQQQISNLQQQQQHLYYSHQINNNNNNNNDHETMSTTLSTTSTLNGVNGYGGLQNNIQIFSDHHHHHQLPKSISPFSLTNYHPQQQQQQGDYGELMLTLPHSQDSSSTTGTTSTTAGTNHNHQSYALYDLAQIANTAQSSSSSLPQTQSATTGIISDEEVIEMKSLMITANELHNPHQQYYSGHTSLMNNNDQNLPTITGSGTNLLLIQQQQTSMK